jgi:phage shock protein PspC (stress-responsive transcriptional regulator)
VKKLHRLAAQKKLAGVCAGLGEYFDLDPLFFRLFFLVSLFFGGIGALVYLLLWVMAPEKAGAGERPPAAGLHLSSADRKIAGVCGGLGERLDVDPVFFRVAFILFALVCGLGIVVYVLLWIFLPRASATPVASG